MGETKKRNVGKQDEQAQTAKKGRRSTSEVVQFIERKVRKRECAEKGGFGVETKGADSKAGYDENASTMKIKHCNHCIRMGSLGKCQTKSKGL